MPSPGMAAIRCSRMGASVERSALLSAPTSAQQVLVPRCGGRHHRPQISGRTPMTDLARVERIADYFDTLARTRGNLPPLPQEIEPQDLDEAYAVQEILQARWAQSRGPVVGYKIAI